MDNSISKIIEAKVGVDVVDLLANKLSGSALNTLLLEVFRERTATLTAPDLLNLYEKNRFTQPAETDYIKLLEKMCDTLKFFSSRGFEVKHLSPLVPLGTCSAVGMVNQDKVVSSLRGTEVLSDATNALALEIASTRKKSKSKKEKHRTIKCCAVQRHVRAQLMNIKGFAPHFTIGCLVTSGRDAGDYTFEKAAIADHILTLSVVLKNLFNVEDLYVRLLNRKNYVQPDFLTKIASHLNTEAPDIAIQTDDHAKDNNYYQGVQFKIMIRKSGRELEIADGGFVDWTQKLLNDKKERYCISGFGLELLNRLEEGLM
ncbi:hypothetical protein [Chryseosolibacter indicus]|uniref:Uncharacterized protein n=1 Tax=Chryseosolibacter indicus TaxID=2782351 RepID=A0ABS5VRP1_9BACT|nr:hypothetical protein [Chryseosolibacter indicus]MBT1704115.1 hypothetical protein [Chryseosolibacter indicus]